MSPKQSVRNDRAIELIRESVQTDGVRGFAKLVDLSPALITKYMKGKTIEPSLATIQKLADYFRVPIPWLQGYWPEMSLEQARIYWKVIYKGNKSGWVGDFKTEDMVLYPEFDSDFKTLQDLVEISKIIPDHLKCSLKRISKTLCLNFLNCIIWHDLPEEQNNEIRACLEILGQPDNE